MIVVLFINFVLLILSIIFYPIPDVTTLPTIGGYDIDAALITATGYVNTIMAGYWYLVYVFAGFAVLMLYYGVKMGVRLFLGSRMPS